MADFAAKFSEVLDRLFPHWNNSVGVLAVSGGADSVALLRAVQQIHPTGRFVVAHLNHGLRGTESEGDEAFVRELAARLNLECRVERIAVAELGGNFESVARTVRYQWLEQVASETQAGWIATGHTADDQAETVLHRLIRGTGVTGLRGIAASRLSLTPTTPQASPTILRPLLDFPRSELLAYLAELNQPYRTDSTNFDLHYTRNRIRAEVVPLLRTFNPAIVNALGRLAAQADELAEWLEEETRKLLLECELPRAGDRIILDCGKIQAAGEVRTRFLLRAIWEREGWPVNAMTAIHWHRAAAVALGRHAAADFPDGVHVRIVGKVVQLRCQS